MESVKININGEETRKAISKITGKMNGIKAFCESAGIEASMVQKLNKACRRGCIRAEDLYVLMGKGVPIVLSNEAVPSRRYREHTRGQTSEPVETAIPEQIDLEDVDDCIPDEMAMPYQMKTLIISHLTDLLEDLKKL